MTAEEVRREIGTAIEAGMQSNLPFARAFWESFPEGRKPTTEEFLRRVVQMLDNELVELRQHRTKTA